MAQVFLSYDRADAPRARVIAQALERAGHFVWWDLHIKGGAEYGKVIEQALEAADAVVVLWSSQSVDSAWVRDEAAAGRDSGRLVPVLIEPVSPPMGFRQYQNLDFSGWKGRGKPPHLAELLDSIEAIGGPYDAKPPAARATTLPPRTPRAPVSPVFKWSLIGGGVMVALILLSLILGDRGRSHRVQTVAVTAADAASSPLARDLLIKLSILQGAKSDSMRLLGQDGEAQKADLVFEAASGSDNNQVGANLVLLAGERREILWSKDFEQPSGKLADLKQQMAFTAAQVLGCALEGTNFEGQSLDQQTLKLYLNACAQFAAQDQPQALIQAFSQVTEKAPRFAPAWAGLLIAKAEAADLTNLGGASNRETLDALRQSIEAARKIHPLLPELKAAEISLLPEHAYLEKFRLADEAKRESPDNPVILNVRSNGLRAVGRLRESIEDAKHALDVDPLSPATLNLYISALAYAGRIDAARDQLAIAERLWPGTASLDDIRFRFHLRFGDAHLALAIARARGAEPPMLMFLEARANPTRQNIERYLAYTVHVQQSVPRVARLSFVLQGWGEFDRVDEMYREFTPWPKREELAALGDILFRPALGSFRRDPRFMEVAAHAGLLDYWLRSGKWPDFCFEPNLPYDCKAEAAKLR